MMNTSETVGSDMFIDRNHKQSFARERWQMLAHVRVLLKCLFVCCSRMRNRINVYFVAACCSRMFTYKKIAKFMNAISQEITKPYHKKTM